jgi:hypothetical protein
MCEGGENWRNVYRYQSVCPVGYNDFDFFKENK